MFGYCKSTYFDYLYPYNTFVVSQYFFILHLNHPGQRRVNPSSIAYIGVGIGVKSEKSLPTRFSIMRQPV